MDYILFCKCINVFVSILAYLILLYLHFSLFFFVVVFVVVFCFVCFFLRSGHFGICCVVDIH